MLHPLPASQLVLVHTGFARIYTYGREGVKHDLHTELHYCSCRGKYSSHAAFWGRHLFSSVFKDDEQKNLLVL